MSKKGKFNKYKGRGLSTKQQKQVEAIAEKKAKNNGELKYKDYYAQEEIISSNDTLPYIRALTDLSKGTSSNQRVGVQVHLRGIHQRRMYHNFSYSTSGGDTVSFAGLIRECIVRVMNKPATADLLKDFFVVNGNSIDFTAASEKQRYFAPIQTNDQDIIWERTTKLARRGHAVGTDADAQNMYNNKIMSVYKKQNRIIRYAQNATDTTTEEAKPEYFHLIWAINSNFDTSSDDNATRVEVTDNIRVYYNDD